jgi:hypothetical protein
LNRTVRYYKLRPVLRAEEQLIFEENESRSGRCGTVDGMGDDDQDEAACPGDNSAAPKLPTADNDGCARHRLHDQVPELAGGNCEEDEYIIRGDNTLLDSLDDFVYIICILLIPAVECIQTQTEITVLQSTIILLRIIPSAPSNPSPTTLFFLSVV